MRVAVIDGQGGGIGKAIVGRLRQAFGPNLDILALGTNPLATAAMLKAGADEGASGENAILVNAPKVNIILGSLGIIAANSMLGELSPAMARAIAESPAQKILVPMNRCHYHIVGTRNEALPQLIDELVEAVKSFMI
ncbi:MAG: DUF3842 family protein [Clostridia bacterium]|nr:DUF3842 family protein [Clostridia bacterium]